MPKPFFPATSRYLNALAGLVLATAATAACYAVAGPSLGLFFGGVAFATLLTPPLIAGESMRRMQLLVAAAIVIGTSLVWFVAVARADTSFTQWIFAALLLAAYLFALVGIVAVLRRIGLAPLFASALATMLGAAWLTWPIWLSPYLAGSAGERWASWLVPAHPLFSLNGQLSHLGFWGEYPLIYRLTNLGQDVPYSQPLHAYNCIFFHAILGGALLMMSMRRRRREKVTATPQTA